MAGDFHHPGARWVSRARYRIRNTIRQRVRHKNEKHVYGRFPASEIPYIMSCSDVVFLGPREALNSGVLPLAATFANPGSVSRHWLFQGIDVRVGG